MRGKIFASFDAENTEPFLPSLCLKLFLQQKNSWPALSAGFAALDHVRIRELRCNGFSVKLQFNPARIASSAALVDPQSIKKRPCFLCTENLPEAQKGILYRQEFLILCNPFPIFRHHYTVSHVNHIPQSFAEAVTFFLKLAKDLSPHYSVFYNGPHSGASAPDHMHFQAAPSGVLPIEKQLLEDHNRQPMKFINGVSLFTAQNLAREVLVIEGRTPDRIESILLRIIDRLKIIIPTTNEPMMNLFCSYRGNIWQVMIFLRRKHRPDVYFKEGQEKILISPGLVDMGGVVITPFEKDFAMIDPGLMENIYREISMDSETVRRVIDAVFL
jgi:hypothetical protein